MDSGTFFQENIFSNDLLRDKIFSYLPRSDLFNCSLISKKWLSPTRKFLHGHHSCMLKLVLIEPEKLAAALEVLENSSEMLFNGVYVDVDLNLRCFSYNDFAEKWQGLLEEMKIKPILQDIFRQIPMTFVVFRSSFMSVRKSIQILHFCLDLLPVEKIQDLKINDRVGEDWNFAFYMPAQGRTFLELKQLNINMRVTSSASLAKFLENFPVLQEWSAEVSPRALACFVEAKKEYLVKNMFLVCSDIIKPNLIPCMKMAQVFLRRIQIYYLDPKPEYIQLLWHLLRTSTSSLQYVGMRFDFFLAFIRSGIYPLKNVTELAIDYSDYNVENPVEDINETIRQDVDTQRIFPNASNIKRWRAQVFPSIVRMMILIN